MAVAAASEKLLLMRAAAESVLDGWYEVDKGRSLRMIPIS